MSEPLRQEDQRFLCLCGLRTWAEAIVLQGERLQQARDGMVTDIRQGKFAYHRERYFFLMATSQLSRHVQWAQRLDYLADARSGVAGSRLLKGLRDLNEHVIEYFEGNGRRPDVWDNHFRNYNADPSSDCGTLLGGAVDWKKVVEDASTFLRALPTPQEFWAGQ